MLEAITYDNMIDELNRRYKGQTRTFAILLCRPGNSLVATDILQNITYYHHRSQDRLDIFLPGYGAYWADNVPNSRNVCRLEETDWSYSDKFYYEFIRDFESRSNFRYRGGSELLLLDFECGDISFEKIVRIKIEKAIKDKAIDSVDELIETVIYKFIGNTDAYNLSDSLTLSEIGKSIGAYLFEEFKFLKIFRRSSHYTIRNYTK